MAMSLEILNAYLEAFTQQIADGNFDIMRKTITEELLPKYNDEPLIVPALILAAEECAKNHRYDNASKILACVADNFIGSRGTTPKLMQQNVAHAAMLLTHKVIEKLQINEDVDVKKQDLLQLLAACQQVYPEGSAQREYSQATQRYLRGSVAESPYDQAWDTAIEEEAKRGSLNEFLGRHKPKLAAKL